MFKNFGYNEHPLVIIKSCCFLRKKLVKCQVLVATELVSRRSVHWVPLTTSSVITSTRIQRANNLVSSGHLLIDHNVKKFSYNEHPATTSTFSCIKVLVVSGTQCTYFNCFSVRDSFLSPYMMLYLFENSKTFFPRSFVVSMDG